MEANAESALSFFGLSEQPFAPTADPAYFYATSAHKECLFRLWSTIDERHGIAVVLGNYGTGKTTLLRKLITGMRAQPDKYNVAVIASPIPSWTSFALLESVTAQFGVRGAERSFASYMEALYQYLVTNRHRINTLIIDDAQNLNKRGQLELLRLVQNLETPQHKLLNLVLFGQLEWSEVLRAAPNFEQRVNTTYTLETLSAQDTHDLIDFRLCQAAVGPQAPVFDSQAVQLIYAFAEGSPRVTVTLCRNALLLAYQLRTRRIGPAIILHTIQKTTLPDNEKRARVAALATASPVHSVVDFDLVEDGASPEGASLGRRVVSLQTVRANRMLLNAARAASSADVRAFAEFDGTATR